MIERGATPWDLGREVREREREFLPVVRCVLLISLIVAMWIDCIY